MSKIILVSGDPNSINSEIIAKSWSKIDQKIKKKIVLITNFDLISDQFKKLKYKISLNKIDTLNNDISDNKINILNMKLNFKNSFNVPKKNASKFVQDCLIKAHSLNIKNNLKGLINCPVSKELLPDNTGVTEFLAKKCKVKNHKETMLIHNSFISVCPITTHINIDKISKNISKKKIINKVLTIDLNYRKLFKKKPRFGILGLNPHNAELRENSEEKKIIIPAIKTLKSFKINVCGPIVPDTAFIDEYKKYNVIVGMYHDQVLTPFKSLYKFNAINLTLGLKYFRMSPDHGVAKDIVGKKIADPKSLLECIRFLNKYC